MIDYLTKWQPRDSQKIALQHLVKVPKCGLFKDPGLGKTSTALAAIRYLKSRGRIKGALVVSVPLVITQVWPREVLKWDFSADMVVSDLTVSCKDQRRANLVKEADIYLITAGVLPWLETELVRLMKNKPGFKVPFDMLVVDESSKLFKNHDTNRFSYLHTLLPLFKRVVMMTGSPAPSSLLELWSQIYCLDAGASLGDNYYKFRSKYFKSSDYSFGWKVKAGAVKAIQNAIKHLCLDFSAAEWLTTLPKLVFSEIDVELPPKARAIYESMEKSLFSTLDCDDSVSAKNSMLRFNSCLQITNGFVYEDLPEDMTKDQKKEFMTVRKSYNVHNAKVDALRELVDSLEGKPLFVAYNFKHELAALLAAFPGAECLGGGVSKSKSASVCNRWNNGEIKILFAHPMSTGHGLNLQEGDCANVCFFSLTPSADNFTQFYKRVYRSGVASSRVTVHLLMASNTIDRYIMDYKLKPRTKGEEDFRAGLRDYRLSKRKSLTT